MSIYLVGRRKDERQAKRTQDSDTRWRGRAGFALVASIVMMASAVLAPVALLAANAVSSGGTGASLAIPVAPLSTGTEAGAASHSAPSGSSPTTRSPHPDVPPTTVAVTLGIATFCLLVPGACALLCAAAPELCVGVILVLFGSWISGIAMAPHTTTTTVTSNGEIFWNETFNLQNGTYHYELEGPRGDIVLGIPPVGNFTVNGTSLTLIGQAIKEKPGTIAFNEAGLAKGTEWCVTLVGTICATKPTIDFKGLTPWNWYPYSVSSVAGYNSSDRSGNVSGSAAEGKLAAGGTVKTPVKFTPVLYPVTFSETGLASGAIWGGPIHCWPIPNGYPCGPRFPCPFPFPWCTLLPIGNTASLTTHLPNGTYNWTPKPVKGYTGPAPRSVIFTVNGTGVTVNVTFTKDPPRALASSPELREMLSPGTVPLVARGDY